MKPILYLDFDTTLVNTTKAMIDTSKYLTNKDPITYDDYTWNLKQAYPDIDKEIIHKTFDIEYFFEVLEMFEGVKKALEELSSYYTLKICSYGTPMNLELKRRWITKHLPMIKKEDLVLLEFNKKHFDKSICKGRAIIDDRLEPLDTCNCDCKILFRYNNNPYEWQEGYKKMVCNNKIDYVATSWEHREFINFLISLSLLNIK